MDATRLGRTGLKISKVILGAMSYGTPAWAPWVLDEAASLPLLEHAYNTGIRTWDTADMYSGGQSETIVGKALKKYSIPRERVVILSKCYCGVDTDVGTEQQAPRGAIMVNGGQFVNRVGLSRKHIFEAVEASVARLGTYIDVLQIHRLDRETPREEIMRALNDVVQSGMVRYIGASSMAAWEFQALQNVAERNGWHKFVSMQGYYSLIYREEEREMLPYCRDAGIGCIPWSPVARGMLTRPWGSSSHRQETDAFISVLVQTAEAENDKLIIDRVEEVAKKHNVAMAVVAIAWVLAKGVSPIVGLGSKERIDQAVEASKFVLPEEDIKYLEEVYQSRAVRGY